MKLTYHQGKNLGDALNPFIFKKFFPQNFFDNSNDIQFLGVGTILGLKKSKGKKIVFTSGLSMSQVSTYGKPPVIDDDYDVFCVRGPLTAEALQLPRDKAVCDGAYLLRDIFSFKKAKKKFDVSYMPHHKSEHFSPELGEICAKLGIEYISPQGDMIDCLNRISESKLVITEAMHGAIIADAFDTPWIPVKSYPFIDDFKWNDFALSMEIKDFGFNYLPSLHTVDFFKEVIKRKSRNLLPKAFVSVVARRLNKIRRKNFEKSIMHLEESGVTYLSEESLKNKKVQVLRDLLEEVKLKYYG